MTVRNMAIDPADTSDERLPGELQLVSEQLFEDAEHLVRTYPANAPRNWRRAFAASVERKMDTTQGGQRKSPVFEYRPRRTASGWVAVAASVSLISLGWYTVHQAARTETTAKPSGVDTPVGESRPRGRLITASVAPTIGGSILRSEMTAPATIVVPFGAEAFQSLSGPEQEAFIDLAIEEGIREIEVRY